MNIVVIADKNYSKFIRPFANSLLNSGTKFNHLYVVKIGTYEDPVLQDILHYDKVKFINSTCGRSNDLITPALCANIRAYYMSRILRDTTEDLLYVDVDSIVINDIEGIKDFCGCARFLHRPWNAKTKMKVASGVVYVRNSQEGKDFINKWDNYTMQFGVEKWFSDQEALYKTSQECVVSDLDKRYIDWEFKKDSFIWTGKGKRKYQNKTYRKAVKKWEL